MKLYKFLITIPIVCISAVSIQKKGLDEIIQTGAQLEKLADGFLFTEGPASDAEGNVYFTDQPNDRIMVWSIAGKLSTFMQPSGRSNGLSFDKEGNLWACADEKNELWCIAPDKKVMVIPSKYQNKPLNGPNDLWIKIMEEYILPTPIIKDPGGIILLCPRIVRLSIIWSPTTKKSSGLPMIWFNPTVLLALPIVKPFLLLISGGRKTWSYTINEDGSLSNKKLFCEMGSDGMTLDVAGNIYLTGKGVTIFDRNGVRIGNIAVPEEWTANVCFGGRDMKSLFITASKSLYRIHTQIKGAY